MTYPIQRYSTRQWNQNINGIQYLQNLVHNLNLLFISRNQPATDRAVHTELVERIQNNVERLRAREYSAVLFDLERILTRENFFGFQRALNQTPGMICCGPSYTKDRDQLPPYPHAMGEYLRSPCPFTFRRSVWQTHVAVPLIPLGRYQDKVFAMTLKNFGWTSDKAAKELRDHATYQGQFQWALITKHSFKNPILPEGYTYPTVTQLLEAKVMTRRSWFYQRAVAILCQPIVEGGENFVGYYHDENGYLEFHLEPQSRVHPNHIEVAPIRLF